jgi:hypothetical protein
MLIFSEWKIDMMTDTHPLLIGLISIVIVFAIAVLIIAVRTIPFKRGPSLSDRIHDERERQILMGYTLEHDDEKGIGHLLYWAAIYIFRGKFIKGFALVAAARDVSDERRSDGYHHR